MYALCKRYRALVTRYRAVCPDPFILTLYTENDALALGRRDSVAGDAIVGANVNSADARDN